MRPSAQVTCGIVAALAACAASERTTSTASSISDAQAFVCRAFARPSDQVRPELLGEIRMSEPGDRSERMGAFRFRVSYSNDRYEGSSLNTYVYGGSTDKLIQHSLFQFGEHHAPENQFAGGHGFTGLHYVNAPDSSAELQYFCSRD